MPEHGSPSYGDAHPAAAAHVEERAIRAAIACSVFGAITKLAGGFFTKDAVTAGGPLVVIYSGDLAGMQTKVQAAGGAIVKEIFSFPGGRRFHFTDPCGNELAVWSDK